MLPTVGIFDSGVGGLTVAAALHRIAPALPIRYLADTACFPYGERPPEWVRERAVDLAARLLEDGAGLLVVACNTASSAALECLRERFDVPIVGMEPPLKPAVEGSRSRRIAVLATPGTTSGARLARLAAAYGQGVEVARLPMPGLADLVEAGEVAGERVESMLRAALAEPVATGIDGVALGCTHYGFLRAALEGLLPEGVRIIDAAEPVARRAVHLLREAGHDPSMGEPAEVLAQATGDAAAFAATIERLRAAGADLPPIRLEAQAAI